MVGSGIRWTGRQRGHLRGQRRPIPDDEDEDDEDPDNDPLEGVKASVGCPQCYKPAIEVTTFNRMCDTVLVIHEYEAHQYADIFYYHRLLEE